jgi:hypothetical protein
MTKLSDQCFTSSAPVFGQIEDTFDPFYSADPAATSPPRSFGAAEACSRIPLRGTAPDTLNTEGTH